jgi:hypothetical protein
MAIGCTTMPGWAKLGRSGATDSDGDGEPAVVDDGDDGSDDDEPRSVFNSEPAAAPTSEGRSGVEADLALSLICTATDRGETGGGGRAEVGLLRAAMEMARTSGFGAVGLCGLWSCAAGAGAVVGVEAC